jgi:hypothetical protein
LGIDSSVALSTIARASWFRSAGLDFGVIV